MDWANSSTHKYTDSLWHYLQFPQSCYVAAPPSLALLWLSNGNCCWMWRSNMRRLWGWLASWQIVYTRRSVLYSCCFACWFVHRLTSVGTCVHATAFVCLCVCAPFRRGVMCVAVWFVMLFMQSICSRCDSCVSSGRQTRRTFFIFKSPPPPPLWEFKPDLHTKHTLSRPLSLSFSHSLCLLSLSE